VSNVDAFAAVRRLMESPTPVRTTSLRAELEQQKQAIERKLDALRVVAQALEFLARVTPSIPGASITLSPAQQDELRQIILAMPLMVAV